MVLTIDIETRAKKEGVINPDTDYLVVVGVKKDDGPCEYYYRNDWWKLKHRLSRDDSPIVGHNLKGFDLVVLKRYGFEFEGKIIIDTLDILKFKNRARAMMYMDLEDKGGFSLANCCKVFGLTALKDEEFDYSVLMEKDLSESQVEYINEYLKHDLEASYALFKHLHDTFIGIKDFMNRKDQEEYKWLTTSPGVCAYKVVCHQAGLREDYDDGVHVDYPGAYVHLPSTEEAHDHVYSFDFKSLYPHCMMMLNVFERARGVDDAIQNFGGYKPKGRYSKSRFGKVSQVLALMFDLKDEYERKGDKAGRLATKIVLNTMYGLLGNPAFKSVFDPVAAEDVTQLGQYFTREAIKMFEDAGLRVLYGDTDSVYLQDPFGDEQRLFLMCREYSSLMNSHTPFPQKTFELALEERIRDIYFFQEKGVFKKKFYLFVNTDGEMTVKGLPIKKRDRCKLSKLVFERLKPKIIEKRTARFPVEVIDSLVKHNFKDARLAGRSLYVKPLSEYKSESCIQAQASKKWGPGKHLIVPVVKGDYNGLEIGKGSMYLRIEDFISMDTSISSVRLGHVFKDLAYFVTGGKDVKDGKTRVDSSVR